MVRRSALLALATALVAGCASGNPAGLSTSASRQHTLGAAAPLSVPAPTVAVIPGYAGPAPTVALQSNNAPALAAQAAQAAATALIATDQSTEALELLAKSTTPYKLEGWFQDLEDAIHRVLTRWKLSAAVRSALKKNDDAAFGLLEGQIDDQSKHRTAPVTTVTDGADGAHEIVSKWQSTLNGDFAITTDRIVDGDGVTQGLTVTQTGITDKGVAVELQRARTLQGADGSYQVVTDTKQTFKDGRTQTSHWTKIVLADGSETLTGSITTPDGWTSQISGVRGTDGKVKVTVSKTAPEPAATGAADPAATDSAASGAA